ncbi:LptF/LptG family permease [Flavobacteriales bacterium]|nr:LptF/LptG family permease [Flavobacteriales bacterium]
MKKLDLYIIRKFLGTYVFMIMVVMSISIIFDISEKLSDFMDKENNLSIGDIVFGYYPYFFIHYANLFSSLIIFLSVLWFTSFMSQRSEIIAILSNGVSFWRFSRPYMIASTFLLIISLFMNHLIAPKANQNRLDFENMYTKYNVNFKDVHLEINKGTLVSYRQFIGNKTMVRRMWIERWEEVEENQWELKSDMQIEKAYGDSLSYNWKLNNVFIRTINQTNESTKFYNEIDTILGFNITDLGHRSEITFAMTTPELVKFRKKEEGKGNSTTFIDIAKYERSAYPFAAYILTVIGIAVASIKSREGVGKNLVIGLGFGLVYIFFMKMTTVAATNIGLYPILAVWVPNLLFSFVALYLYFKRVKT